MSFPNTNRRIAELIFKYLEDTLSEEERVELNTWISESDEHHKEFEALIDRPVLLKRYGHYIKSMPDMDVVWQSVNRKIEGDAAQTTTRKRKLSAQLSGAIVLCILIITVGMLWYKVREKEALAVKEAGVKSMPAAANNAILTLSDGRTIELDNKIAKGLAREGTVTVDKENNRLVYHDPKGMDGHEKVLLNTLTTPRGLQYQVILPDGTKVWLNALSSIRFPVVFSANERTVEISGELYFEVAKDAQRPFKVLVQPAGTNKKCEIEVLGTHFNVNAYPDEDFMRTTLLEGKISLTTHNSQTIASSKTLEEGVAAMIRDGDGRIKVDTVNAATSISWLKGHFIFDKASVEEVMRVVARWHQVEVVYLEKPKPATLVGEVPRDIPLKELLERLGNASNCRFILKEGKILVSAK